MSFIGSEAAPPPKTSARDKIGIQNHRRSKLKQNFYIAVFSRPPLNTHSEGDSGRAILNQHGWRHVNHERAGRKCEFGASRGYEQQLEDIANGRRRMNEAFGDGWSPVFTPPWSRRAEETFRALDQLGFAALSKSHDGRPATGYKFREISITFDLYRWNGGPAMQSPESIVEELITQMNELDTIGILLRHKVMDSTALSLLGRLIGMLRIYLGVRFHTFQSLPSLGARAPLRAES